MYFRWEIYVIYWPGRIAGKSTCAVGRLSRIAGTTSSIRTRVSLTLWPSPPNPWGVSINPGVGLDETYFPSIYLQCHTKIKITFWLYNYTFVHFTRKYEQWRIVKSHLKFFCLNQHHFPLSRRSPFFSLGTSDSVTFEQLRDLLSPSTVNAIVDFCVHLTLLEHAIAKADLSVRHVMVFCSDRWI